MGWISFSRVIVVTGGELLTVAAAEQEDEAVQVVAQVLDAVAGVADELLQRCAEAAGVAGQPLARKESISASSAASPMSRVALGVWAPRSRWRCQAGQRLAARAG